MLELLYFHYNFAYCNIITYKSSQNLEKEQKNQKIFKD